MTGLLDLVFAHFWAGCKTGPWQTASTVRQKSVFHLANAGLGVLVLISVAFIHLSKPKALMVAMAIATLTILTPLCILALTLSNPYQGLISISNDPYLQILNRGVIDLVW